VRESRAEKRLHRGSGERFRAATRLLVLAAIASLGDCDCHQLGQVCEIADDCGAELVCYQGRCHQTCAGDQDCSGAEACRHGVCFVAGDAGNPRDAARIDSRSADASSADLAPTDTAAPDTVTSLDSAQPDFGSQVNEAGVIEAGAAACDLLALDWAFGTPTVVAELNTSAAEQNPTLSADGLVIYFSSTRTGSFGARDLYKAKRTARDAAFESIERIEELSTSSDEGKLTVSADGLSVFFASNRSGDPDIWTASRAAPGDPFTAIVPVAAVNTDSAEHDPAINASGLRLYLSSDGLVGGLGGQDVVVASRPDLGSDFGLPVLAGGLNTSSAEADPAPSVDELLIVFVSMRGGAGTDLYAASRGSVFDDFDPPVALTRLNSTEGDNDPFISADGCELFFSSRRSGGAGDWDIWVAPYVPGS